LRKGEGFAVVIAGKARFPQPALWRQGARRKKRGQQKKTGVLKISKEVGKNTAVAGPGGVAAGAKSTDRRFCVSPDTVIPSNTAPGQKTRQHKNLGEAKAERREWAEIFPSKGRKPEGTCQCRARRGGREPARTPRPINGRKEDRTHRTRFQFQEEYICRANYRTNNGGFSKKKGRGEFASDVDPPCFRCPVPRVRRPPPPKTKGHN